MPLQHAILPLLSLLLLIGMGVVAFFYANIRRINANLKKLNASLEQKVIDNTRELSQNISDLKRNEKARKEFIAGITHDLKSPLAVVAGHTELIKYNVKPGSDLWKFAENIFASTNHLSRLVDRLVSTALLEREEKPSLDVYDYALYVRTFFNLFHDTARRKNIRYELIIAPEPIIIEADITWLERTLGNLLQNAFKFTPSGGSITIQVHKQGSNVCTRIIDSGIGIPSDKIERIFERGFQADEAHKKQGFGLGLHIVKETLTKLGGDITVTSSVGEGSTFTISLPTYKNQKADVQKTTAQILGASSGSNESIIPLLKRAIEAESQNSDYLEDLAAYENASPEKLTLMLVDDTPGQLSLTVTALKKDYNLLIAQSGSEALEKLAKHNGKVSMILSDMRMDDMSGLELRRTLAENPKYCQIPFFILTAYANDDDALKSYKIGAFEYLSKPVNTFILKERINLWLNMKPQGNC